MRIIHNTPDYELVSIDALPEGLKHYVPPLYQRRALQVDDAVRIQVRAPGEPEPIYPWVTVIERTPTGYIGEVRGAIDDIEWLPVDSRIVFLADHVVEI